MKKNITINLFGTLYNIDEDACELLEQYLQSMKSYFSRQEGGEEIADDIEHRVAELLWQQKQSGIEAVTIEHIRVIIGKIGNPSDIDEPQGDNYDKSEKSNYTQSEGRSTGAGSTMEENFQSFARDAGAATRKAYDNTRRYMHGRKLFRDPSDRLLGGVCSGIARYLDVDPVWVRLGTVIIALCTQFIITPVYIVLWFIVPEAHTAEDTLRMKGADVNPESINEEILRQSTEPRTKRDVPGQVAQSGCLKVLFGVVLAILLFPLLLILLTVIFSFVLIGSFTHGLLGQIFGGLFNSWFPAQMPEFVTNNHFPLWGGVFAGLILVIIPIYFIIRALRSGEKRMSTSSIVWTIAIWLTCLVVLAVCTGFSIKNYNNWEWDIRHGYLIEPTPSQEEVGSQEETSGTEETDTLIVDPNTEIEE